MIPGSDSSDVMQIVNSTLQHGYMHVHTFVGATNLGNSKSISGENLLRAVHTVLYSFM